MHHLPPVGVVGDLVEHRLVDVDRLLLVALLLRREAEIEAGHRQSRRFSEGLVDGSPRFGGHKSAGRRHLGLAKRGARLRVLALDAEHLLPGVDRVPVTAEAHVDRGERRPGLQVVGRRFRFRLDMRHRRRDIVLSVGGGRPRGKRSVREVRRAVLKIEADGDDRDDERAENRRDQPAAAAPNRRPSFERVGGDEAARRFGAGCGGLRRKQLTALHITVDLGQLGLIEGDLAWRIAGPSAAGHDRPKRDHDGDRRHGGQDDPNHPSTLREPGPVGPWRRTLLEHRVPSRNEPVSAGGRNRREIRARKDPPGGLTQFFR